MVNFNRQIFIGESANIREALLRRESETDFKSHGLKPTGFTCELCGAESRKLWAAELIARFQPLLQKEVVDRTAVALKRSNPKRNGSNIADKLVQQLKAKGYDGYVIEANVKGQTYYRVRVGRFPKREEAESTRQSLALHESYEQAFVA